MTDFYGKSSEGLREDKPVRDVVRPLAAIETVAAGRKF
jgi:hypothetical protein